MALAERKPLVMTSLALGTLVLVVVPLLARRSGRAAILAIAVASAALATVQVVAPRAFSFGPVDGERPSPFEADAGCGLVNCGLDHTIFHFVQLPFLLAMAALAYRLYQTSGEATDPARTSATS